MTTSIRAILFDFGGVLAEEGFRNGLITLAREQGLAVDNMPYEGMRAVYDSGFVLGLGNEKYFWALLRQRTALKGSDKELTERIMHGFIVRPWMIDTVRRLRQQGFITAILSDQTNWLDRLDEQYHFYNAFDRRYISFYLGKGKQDKSIFNDVANDLGLPPTKLLFIDDDIGNIERARSMHFHTIHYQDKEQFLDELEKLTG